MTDSYLAFWFWLRPYCFVFFRFHFFFIFTPKSPQNDIYLIAGIVSKLHFLKCWNLLGMTIFLALFPSLARSTKNFFTLHIIQDCFHIKNVSKCVNLGRFLDFELPNTTFSCMVKTYDSKISPKWHFFCFESEEIPVAF